MRLRPRILTDRLRRRGVQRRRGGVLIIVAVALIALLGVAALSIDAGNLYQERRRAQSAADAAANAGALELHAKYAQYGGADQDGRARASAFALAASHGYANNATTTTQVNIPPASGPFANRAGYVEVIVTSRMSRGFSAIFDRDSLEVRSRAVAAGTYIPSSASILILDPKRKDSLKLKGKTSSLEVAGDVVVNSNAKRAVKVAKKSQIIAEHLLVTGGMEKKLKGLIDAEVSTGVPPTPDPWISLAPPPKGVDRDPLKQMTTANGQRVFSLQPGKYKELVFTKNDVVNLAPGTYYVDGGKFEFKDQASLVGQGVMLYNAGKKGVKFKTQGNVTLTPPTSGNYAGISVFQNRDTKAKVEFKKGTQFNIQGLVYAPNAEVKFDKVDGDLGGDDDSEYDDDWELEDENEEIENDGEPIELTSIGASLVAGRLTIGKGSHLRVQGVSIGNTRPFIGVVE